MRLQALVMGLALVAGPGFADLKVYLARGEVRTVSKAMLGANGKKLFAEFRAEPKYFGAFYYNAVDDQPWYMNDMPVLADAQGVAKTRCEESSAHQGQCQLYAVSVPKGFSAKTSGAEGLSWIAAKGYKERYLPQLKAGRFAAFAQSGTGDIGYSFDLGSAAAADKLALQYCKSATAKGLQGLTAGTRKVIKQIGADRCAVVFRDGP